MCSTQNTIAPYRSSRVRQRRPSRTLPFQRRDDRSSSACGAGVGLGLAVARGFTEAKGGALTADDSPGDATMTVPLLVAQAVPDLLDQPEAGPRTRLRGQPQP